MIQVACTFHFLLWALARDTYFFVVGVLGLLLTGDASIIVFGSQARCYFFEPHTSV